MGEGNKRFSEIKPHNHMKKIICPQCGLQYAESCQTVRCLRCNKLFDNELLINKQCQGNCRKCHKTLRI